MYIQRQVYCTVLGGDGLTDLLSVKKWTKAYDLSQTRPFSSFIFPINESFTSIILDTIESSLKFSYIDLSQFFLGNYLS